VERIFRRAVPLRRPSFFSPPKTDYSMSLTTYLSSRTQPILLAIGFLVLILISGATAWMVNQSAVDSQAVSHTLTVQDRFSNLLLDIRRAESAQRGYLFTNNDSYLDDYKIAIPEAEHELTDLTELTSDNPERRPLLQQISEALKQKSAEMNRTIELNASGAREEARALVLNGGGRETMNALRAFAEEGIQDEGRLLAQRSEKSSHNNKILLTTSFVGAALIVLIGGFVIYLVQRALRQREAAAAALASNNANLERIVSHRTADLTEANEEIQRFAYIVTHDLRAPLVNIMGFTSELERFREELFEQISDLESQTGALSLQAGMQEQTGASKHNTAALGVDFDEAVSFIKASIAKMDRLINAVLKLSREGRREFRGETINMVEMLNTISRTVAHQAAEQNATITVDDLPSVESDRLAVEQIFSNLIDNALKYGRPDEPARIEVSGRLTGEQATYEVRDNGRGIDSRDHQRVFELFRRSGPQDRPGEGIGLAHVRALVRRLGGRMELSSAVGKGSVFIVVLPRQWTAKESRGAV
jgi:hypothetical protein